MTVDREASLVPLTEGRVRTSGQMALVLFFPDGQQDERAAAFHRTLIKQQVSRGRSRGGNSQSVLADGPITQRELTASPAGGSH